MKSIESILPYALKAARKELVKVDGFSIREEYDGYVASFVPSIRTSGLLTTLSFYTDIHKDDKQDKSDRDNREPKRCHVLIAIYRIVNKDFVSDIKSDDLLYYVLNETYGVDLRKAKDFPSKSISASATLKKEIMDAAIALKLALRNFKQVPK